MRCDGSRLSQQVIPIYLQSSAVQETLAVKLWAARPIMARIRNARAAEKVPRTLKTITLPHHAACSRRRLNTISQDFRTELRVLARHRQATPASQLAEPKFRSSNSHRAEAELCMRDYIEPLCYLIGS